MTNHIISNKAFATLGGSIALAAGINQTIAHSGAGLSAYLSSNALVAAASGIAVFAAARVLGAGTKDVGKVAAVLVVALCSGEIYNGYQTVRTTVTVQEQAAAPLLKQKQKHDDAVKHLRDVENAQPDSLRLKAARQALADAKSGGTSQRVTDAQAALDRAQKAADAEASNGCKTVCRQKQDQVAQARKDLAAAIAGAAQDRQTALVSAEQEVVAAIADAEQKHAAELANAKADVEANPPGISPTSLSDRTGVPAWVLDLFEALCRSISLNLFAAALIGYGARPDISKASESVQTDFPASAAADAALAAMFRPDRPNPGENPGKPGPDRPKRPGPSGGLSKSEAFDDLMRRLSEGEEVPSYQKLADDWNRPKTTVSDWMKGWRKIGVIPAPVQVGRCKVMAAAVES